MKLDLPFMVPHTGHFLKYLLSDLYKMACSECFVIYRLV